MNSSKEDDHLLAPEPLCKTGYLLLQPKTNLSTLQQTTVKVEEQKDEASYEEEWYGTNIQKTKYVGWVYKQADRLAYSK